MKQHQYLLLFILFSGVVFAQKIEKTKDFQAEDLKSKKTGISFRFWIDGQIIELERSADAVYTGRIINIAEEQIAYRSMEEKIKAEKSAPVTYTYYQKNELSAEKVLHIFKIIDEYKILDLPDETAITNWNHQFLDGYNYQTEQNRNGHYEQKIYGNPSRQKKDIPAATALMAFHNDLLKKLQLESNFNAFFNKLKVGCYKTQRGGYSLQCRKSKTYVFFHRLFRKKHKKQETATQ